MEGTFLRLLAAAERQHGRAGALAVWRREARDPWTFAAAVLALSAAALAAAWLPARRAAAVDPLVALRAE